MTEFKCDTRSHGNFLYGKKQSVFTVLYRLYNYCSAKKTMEVNGVDYQSWHEVGHAMVCLLLGGEVELIEFVDDENSIGVAKARCDYPPEIKRAIACGGFAAEYLLFQEGYIKMSWREFTDKMFDNAVRDRISFFDGDFAQEDGFWPKEMDKEFGYFAIRQVAPLLKPWFRVMKTVVRELVLKRKLNSQNIHKIIKA